MTAYSFTKSATLALFLFANASSAMDYATKAVHELERQYIDDCTVNKQPHGFYGAFLQPCEFTFRKSSIPSGALESAANGKSDTTSGTMETNIIANYLEDDSSDNQPVSKLMMLTNDMACSDTFSSIVSQPVPLNWFFNFTDKFAESSDSWDSFRSSSSSSEDFSEIMDKLMLWPDQCVGVTPRCYSVFDPAVHNKLAQLFDEIPEGATHVQVNCQSDAFELSRVVYAAADGFEKSTPTIIAWMVTILLVSLVTSMWCCYGCFRLLHVACVSRHPTTGMYGSVKDSYVVIEDGDSVMNEKRRLLNE